jgi:hypothetical protein
MAEVAAGVILKTLDMAVTIRWYTAAGFELRDRFPDTEPTWCDTLVRYAGNDRMPLSPPTQRLRRT